jgi:predicted MFS family arabinose efflux permease
MVGILVDQANFSESYAGWVMAYGSAGSALTLIVISGYIHRINLKKLSYVCLSIAVLIDIYCSLIVEPNFIFLASRFAIGVVATIANIAVYTSIASLKNYERGYGLFVMMQYSISGLGLYYLILYSESIGAMGLYQILALLNFLALLLVNQLPNLKNDQNADGNTKSEVTVLLSGVAFMAIIGFGLHEMSGVTQFTFIERIGVSISIESQSLSNIMLIASLLGIPGSMVCIILGNKFGLLPPFLFGISCCLFGMSILLIEKTFITYALRMCLIGFGWSIALPYIQSHLASIDKKGSALAAGNSLATIGGAAGAALGASLIGLTSNYNMLLQVSILIYILAIILIILSIRIRRTQS